MASFAGKEKWLWLAPSLLLALASCTRHAPEQKDVGAIGPETTTQDAPAPADTAPPVAVTEATPPSESSNATPPEPASRAAREPVRFADAPASSTTCPMPYKVSEKAGEPDQLRPKFDRAEETLWVGKGAKAGAAFSHGAWSKAADTLRPPPSTATPSAEGEEELEPGAVPIASPSVFWAPASKKSRLTDGLVRARFSIMGGLDYDLILRGQLDPSGKKVIDGWGVILRDGVTWVVRYGGDRPGEQRTMLERLYKLEKREEIEILAYVLGDRLHVQVHDARSGVELISSQIEDPSIPASGMVGIAVPPDHENGSGALLTHLSQRALCKAKIPDMPEQRPPRVFLTLAPSQWERTPAPVRAMLTELEPADKPHGAKHYQTDSVGMEALFCAGVRPIESSAEIPWKYVDEEYLANKHSLPVKDETGIRVDLSYKNPRMVETLLRAFHEAYPTVTRLETIGTTHQGRPILAMAIADNLIANDPRPSMLLNGAHHGDEPISTEIVFDAIEYLLDDTIEDPRKKLWRSSFVTWVVPQVNPDGANAFLEQSFRMGRKNGREVDGVKGHRRDEGVDLNRNYPFRWHSLGEEGSSSNGSSSYYRGAVAGSEPETKAMMALAERERFAASISYHTGTVCILAPYTIDEVENPSPNEAWEIGAEISSAMPRHPEGRSFRLRKNLYPVDGTDQDWFRAEHGTVALLVEAVRRTPRNFCTRRPVVEANRPSWMLLFDRFIKGPTLLGQVVDREGRALEARVEILEQEVRAGEIWTSRPRDGKFARMFASPGTYSVRVSADGYLPVTRKVRVGAKKSPEEGAITRLEVVLEAADSAKNE